MSKKKIIPSIIFIVLLLGMSLFPYLPILIFRINIDNLNNTLKVYYSLACDLGYMLIIYVIYRKTINKDFKNYFCNFKNNFRISIKYYLIGYFIMLISNSLIAIFFSEATSQNEDTIRMMINLYPAYMLFSVGFYAPFVEEIIFRKSIKDAIYAFKENNTVKYIYIFISGFIFAGLHIIGLTTSPIDYIYIIPYLSLGIAFSALYVKTDNIFSTIVMHALHNLIAIMLYLGVGI